MNSQYISAVLPQNLFDQDRDLIFIFKSFFAFSHANFPACTDVFFHIIVTPFLLKYGASFFICYMILLATFLG